VHKNLVYLPDGTFARSRSRWAMGFGKLQDDASWSFYFPKDHEHEGLFRGTTKVLDA
jgi:hypothetical protein